MITFKPKKEPMAQVLYEIIKLINSKITYNSIREKLLRHPSYPYLISITNTLSHFKISNKAVRLKQEDLANLATPFLAITQSNDTLLIKEVTNKNITYFSKSESWKKISLPKFIKSWSNIVILIDTEKSVEETDYGKKKAMERLLSYRLPITFLLSTLVVIYIFFSFTNPLISFYFLCKFFGLIVSIFLVNKEVNKNTKYSFCKIGSKIDCDEVLNSPAAKIFSWLSMTDLSFLYFSGTVLALSLSTMVIPLISIQMQTILVLLGFTTIPYTIFSLVYQVLVIKRYCTLCLVTIIILWFESLLGYSFMTQSFFQNTIEYRAIINVAICLSCFSIFWMFFKNIFTKYSKYDFHDFSNSRIANNYDIFQISLQSQKAVEINIQPTEVTIGKNNAPNVFVMAINPYCLACGKEFEMILILLKKHPNYAKIVLRFVGDLRENNQSRVFTSVMLVSQYLNSKTDYTTLLQHWFKNRNIESFLHSNPVKHNKESEKIIENHYIWAAKAKIESTPTLYLNGKEFPRNYTLSQFIEILSMRVI